MHWLYLLTAVVFETIGTSALKASEGFTRAAPSALVVVAYALSFFLLSQALRAMPVGVAYAVWSGLGIVLIALIGRIVFGQTLDAPALIGIGLIAAGIVTLSLFSNATH